ncbi:hypothetical protein [Bacteroides thetaiotaomicron]|uniref:hypothetical protein n=1 Tax=Bacteroides thetaiotaomicron TaxID=818 RepID=UPI002165554C|nr:hypothetical protein [Bacteroides thetaiotaomicron]MCS3196631.1 hypothetical protein [Bacteroides thetaiotaomicron]
MTTKQILGLTLLILGIGVVIISGSVLVALIGFALLLMGKKKQENTESNTGKVLFMIGLFLPLPIYILSKGRYHSFFNDKLIYILCAFLSLAGTGISLKGFFKMRKESKKQTNIGQILLLISTMISTFPYIIYLIQSFLGATYSPSIYLLDISLLFLYLFLVIAGGVLWKYLNKHANMSSMGLSLICIGTILMYFSVIRGYLSISPLPFSLTQYTNSFAVLVVELIGLTLGPFICFYGWYKFIGFNKPKSHN